VRMAIAMPILAVALVLAVPSQLRNRYTTLVKSQNDGSLTANEEEASGSTEARLELLKDSITTTIMHPLFGVGPGNFMVQQAQLALDRGEAYGMWHVTHNSYTELSSETGIPGLLIYLAFVVQCWRVLTRIRRRRYVSKDVRVMSQTLQAALVVLVTVAFFDSVGYGPNIPILAGLITALSVIARNQQVGYETKSRGNEATPSLPEPEYEPALTSPLYN
jgi:O-antigen ligase